MSGVTCVLLQCLHNLEDEARRIEVMPYFSPLFSNPVAYYFVCYSNQQSLLFFYLNKKLIKFEGFPIEMVFQRLLFTVGNLKRTCNMYLVTVLDITLIKFNAGHVLAVHS